MTMNLKKQDEAVLSGETYQPVLDEKHQWSNWACPKNADGKLDLNRARTGDDLNRICEQRTFPIFEKICQCLYDS